MNISSFIVKASSERSDKSLGCLIPMTIGRVPRLSRRNKQLQIKLGSSRLFDTFLAMKKVWNYKIRFSISLMIRESRQKGKNYFFIYFSFPIDEKNQKSRLILFVLNATRNYTVASRPQAIWFLNISQKFIILFFSTQIHLIALKYFYSF